MTNQLREMVRASTAAVLDARDRLNELDGVAGDGDHGMTAARVAREINVWLDENPDDDTRQLLEAINGAFMRAGGTAGPVFGFALEGARKHLEGIRRPISVDDLAAATDAAINAVTALSGAAPGDKTMVDALAGLRTSLQQSAGRGADIPTALGAASIATAAAAEATSAMTARVGRASRLGERSQGSPDAGAMTVATVVEALARVAGTVRP
jgi:dihydroxyacetone kinase